MKIAIDARFLTHPQLGGFKTYTVNLTRALSQIDRDNQYILYLDRPPTEGNALPEAENFTYQVVPAKFSVVGMPIREQILLKRQILRDEPDVVHFLCNTAPVNMPQNSILSLLDVIQVKEPQDFPTSTSLENYRRWAISAYSKWTILKTIEKAEKIITLSYFEKDEIRRHLNVPAERIHVTYFGINNVFAQASPQARQILRTRACQKYGLENKFIMGVGYEPRKNIPLLIEAFALIAQSRHDLHLVIVSAEKERSFYFKQLAVNLGLVDRVHILGAVQPDELADLYNLAEVFVFPSERESFGAPPLEALACGAPTVAMNMTSLPEVLADGALLVDGKDPQNWADVIQQAAANSKLRNELVERGLKRASEMTWQKCAEETLKIYYEVAEAKG